MESSSSTPAQMLLVLIDITKKSCAKLDTGDTCFLLPAPITLAYRDAM